MANEGRTGSWSGYRRRILIVPRPGLIDVEMEDDCHHFGVAIRHDGERITQVETRALRVPWTTCPAAGLYLEQRMQGVTLNKAARVDDQRQHCTHMYDLFVLGAAHAHDEARTRYEVRVSDPVDAVRLAELDRDGVTILRWRVGNGADAAEIPGGDVGALSQWTRALPGALQEAGRMMRRGVLVSGGRYFHPPVSQVAADIVPIMGAACFTYQPQRAHDAQRVDDTLRDFSEEPEKMLDGEWDD